MKGLYANIKAKKDRIAAGSKVARRRCESLAQRERLPQPLLSNLLKQLRSLRNNYLA